MVGLDGQLVNSKPNVRRKTIFKLCNIESFPANVSDTDNNVDMTGTSVGRAMDASTPLWGTLVTFRSAIDRSCSSGSHRTVRLL
jgi:hypothetical protein